ncbi:endosome-associated-trafficking regulator 1 isoform 3-T3 [Spinachia spinachia]
MSKQKSLIITDDEDLNPFSFREFLRWKNQDRDQDRDLNPGEEPGRPPQEEEEEGWGRSFLSGVGSMSSVCKEEDVEGEDTRFSAKPEVQSGEGGAVSGGGGGAENYEGADEISVAEAVTSCKRRSSRCSQIQELKEENISLRNSFRELQRRSDANKHRVAALSEELVKRRSQEEKEALDLESMVHSVEQNLHLMTKRALKAESCVSRLKVELMQLQSENHRLKAAESEIVMTMRHNAHLASEHLNKTASHAHSSIRH